MLFKLILVTGVLYFGMHLPGGSIKYKDVPEAVKQAFKKQYPSINGESWDKENDLYEAEFKMRSIEHSAVYDDKGTFIESEHEIKISELPALAVEYLKTAAPGKKIDEASKIESADKVVTYEAEVEDTDYLFDAEGKFLRTEKESGKDD